MAAPVFSTVAVTQGSLGSMTATKPSGVVSGDLLITALVTQATSTSLSIVTLSGWTLIRQSAIGGANDKQHAVYYRIAGGSEPSTWTWTLSNGGATTYWSNAVSRITGIDTTNPINISGIQANASSASVTAPSITTTVNDCLLLFTGADTNGRTYTAPTGMVEKWEDRVNGTFDDSHSGAVETLTTAGATGTRAATLNAATINVGCLIAIAPVASPFTGMLKRPISMSGMSSNALE